MGDVRTSTTHPLRVDWLPAPGAGVGLTFAPGMKTRSAAQFDWDRDLDADLARLVAEGATTLVSLIEEHELARYRIGDLAGRAAAHGLGLLRLPIRDGDVPADLSRIEALLDDVELRVARGERVVVHCRGGLGRTGLVAGCLLVRRGMAPEATLAALRATRRDDRCPETEAQREVVRRYGSARLRARLGMPLRHDAPEPARGDLGVVSNTLIRVEHEVRSRGEACFSLDASGHATLDAAGGSWSAGRFETPSLGELRARAAAGRATRPGRLSLAALIGPKHADIGALQAGALPGTLFQVASQFNCLESPGPGVVPVQNYLHDYTQGPRASVSAFPGTFLRHYFAPVDGRRVVQGEDGAVDLLRDVIPAALGGVRGGYLLPSYVSDLGALADALERDFDRIRVGLHAEVEVVFGFDWAGALPRGPLRIAQALTSTFDMAGAGEGGPDLVRARRCLLRAAYLGTLLGAIALGQRAVVLTLIGGGVFGNPHPEIWDAILWAAAQIAPDVVGSLDVVINARDGLTPALRELLAGRSVRLLDPAEAV